MNHSYALSNAAAKYLALEDQFGAHNYHPIPVVIEKGEGVFLYDVDGIIKKISSFQHSEFDKEEIKNRENIIKRDYN